MLNIYNTEILIKRHLFFFREQAEAFEVSSALALRWLEILPKALGLPNVEKVRTTYLFILIVKFFTKINKKIARHIYLEQLFVTI